MSRALGFIFCVFFFLTVRDMYQARRDPSGQSPDDFEDDSSDLGRTRKEVPSTRLNELPSMNVISIKYCYSCGYKRTFDQYMETIQRIDPTFVVNGENYNPPGLRMYLAQFNSVAKFAFIIVVLTGFWPSQLDLVVPAPIKAWIFNHKLYACLMAFFLSNTLESSLVSSGAFEIYYQGKLP
jgi:selT/selW/selH-like putative selenoprotein